jgi:hypothetical protein
MQTAASEAANEAMPRKESTNDFDRGMSDGCNIGWYAGALNVLMLLSIEAKAKRQQDRTLYDDDGSVLVDCNGVVRKDCVNHYSTHGGGSRALWVAAGVEDPRTEDYDSYKHYKAGDTVIGWN